MLDNCKPSINQSREGEPGEVALAGMPKCWPTGRRRTTNVGARGDSLYYARAVHNWTWMDWMMNRAEKCVSCRFDRCGGSGSGNGWLMA